jgi:tetratricopeptide (TPR) repeat protein
MVSAMVAISEIYMTDLWCVLSPLAMMQVLVLHTSSLEWTQSDPSSVKTSDEEDAEQTCSDRLEEALTVDPSSWEALQALASFRISQQNPEDALLQLTRSYEIWKELEPEDIDSPSYDARVAASKLFVELEAYEMGAEVLESLLEDNDEDAETWYLCAFCYSHTDITSAPECLETAKKLLKKQKIEEPAIHKQVDDLSVTVAEKLASMGISVDEIPSNGGQPEFDSDTEFMDE